MEYTRWYDKDKDLSGLIGLIEKLPRDVQIELAGEIVQIILEIDPEKADANLNNLSKDIPASYKRWYDKDVSVHCAIELIRLLDPALRQDLIAIVSTSIIQILAELK